MNRNVVSTLALELALSCVLSSACADSPMQTSPGQAGSTGTLVSPTTPGSSGSSAAVSGNGASANAGAHAATPPSAGVGVTGPKSGASGASTPASTAAAAGTTAANGGGGGASFTAGASAASAGASAGASGAAAASDSDTPSEQFLPKAKGTCPKLSTGSATFAGESVQVWVGAPKPEDHGPLLLYWHATGTNSGEAPLFFGQAQIDAITALGGMVASFTNSNRKGMDTGNGVWFTGDFDTADEVVACAIDTLHIDPRRIYSSGGSAGALQATWISYARSGYIAAVAPISGGLTLESGGGYGELMMPPQDPTNVPAAIVAHGAKGSDVVIIDFAEMSAEYEADMAKRGGFSVDCNNKGGHVATPPGISPALWEFMKDHPFKVKPEPYLNGLPMDFPDYCQIGPRAADGGPPKPPDAGM
jgi:hypothetical protein